MKSLFLRMKKLIFLSEGDRREYGLIAKTSSLRKTPSLPIPGNLIKTMGNDPWDGKGITDDFATLLSVTIVQWTVTKSDWRVGRCFGHYTELSSEHFANLLWKNLLIHPHKDLCPHVHSGIINNKQTMETKCPSVGEWINKNQPSHTTEYYLVIKRKYWQCYNMNEPQKHYARWAKPDRKDGILYWLIRNVFLKTGQIYRDSRLVVAWSWGWGRNGDSQQTGPWNLLVQMF